jgi:Sec-independent protein secretion pathway component TatC
VLFFIVLFAVIATPGGDPISPSIMAAVMYPLYELTIILVRRANRPAQPEAE